MTDSEIAAVIDGIARATLGEAEVFGVEVSRGLGWQGDPVLWITVTLRDPVAVAGPRLTRLMRLSKDQLNAAAELADPVYSWRRAKPARVRRAAA